MLAHLRPATDVSGGAAVQRRVLQLGAGLVLCVVVVAVIAGYNANRTSGLVDTFAQNDVVALQLLLNADRDAYQARVALLQATLEDTKEAAAGHVADWQENVDQVGDRFAEYEALSLDREGEAELQADFARAYEDWRSQTARIALDPNGVTKGVIDADPAFDAFRDAIDGIVGVYEADVEGFAPMIGDVANAAERLLLLTVLLVLGLGGTVLWRTAAGIRRRLDDAAVDRAAATESMRATNERNVAAAATLVGTAAQLSELSEALLDSANATTEQAAHAARSADDVAGNVESVAAAVEEMSATIREIAANVGEAARVAGEAVSAVNETTTTVADLGVASREIGEVIQVIAGIAEQTNLLALNATIEAARAGEHGKGFAVVANEVKDLAQETARATTTITAQIQGIQRTSGESVEAIDTIRGVIDKVADLQGQISAAVEEQASATSEISSSLQRASSSTASISRTARAVASSAEQTADQARSVQASSGEVGEVAAGLETDGEPVDAAPVDRTRPSAPPPASPVDALGGGRDGSEVPDRSAVVAGVGAGTDG